MFRRILFLSVLLAYAFHIHGNTKADELRKSMYQAPDSAKAAILVNIAQLFQYDNVDSCLIYAQKANDKGYSTRQYLAVLDAQKLMSRIAIEKRDYTKASAHQRNIRDLSIRERLWDIAMENFNDMAQTWLLRSNYAEAVDFLKSGLEISVDRGNLEMQKYFYNALIESYRKLHRINDVCLYYPLLMEVNRMIDAEAFNSRINALQTEREDLLVAAEDAKNRWQQRSTISKVFHVFAVIWAVLVTALLVMAYIWFEYKFKPDTAKAQNEMRLKAEELDLLIKNQGNAFRFLTDHVQTGLNSLTQNINLLKGKKVAADSPLGRIKDRIQALYDFFRNFTLLLQAQSGQLKPILTTVNIPQLANNLCVEYDKQAKAKKIQLNNDVQNNTFAIADERLMDIILHNLISNAFQFAPEGTGNISIGAKVGTRVDFGDGIAEDTGFVEIWVTDDGFGLTPEQAEFMFDLSNDLIIPGDHEIKNYGIGLALCKAVVETMKGRIWAETKPGEGLCIRFCLPKTKGPQVTTLSLVEDTQETISAEDNPQLLLPE